MMDTRRISEITGGQHFGKNALIDGLVNDSRKDCDNKLYVAISGPNFDGHDYVDQAYEKGAKGALIEQVAEQVEQMSLVKVTDSIDAMGKIAAHWRRDFQIPVLAITGSAGKTTLKELAGSILSVSKTGIITKGNLNNHIGVPLTLTRISSEDQFAVIEMGMSHAGEIRYLSKMTAPTVAIINNAAHAHLDELETVEAVAYAKGEIIDGLVEDGVQILNADDQYCDLWQSLAVGKNVITFGLDSNADISAKFEANSEGSKIHVKGCYGEFPVSINLPGKHNVRNALAVIAATLEMGCSIEDVQKGLSQYHPMSNRGGIHQFKSIKIVDDTYNANPVSMKAAFNTIELHAQQLKKEHKQIKTTVILGEMGELGKLSSAMHRDVGAAANKVADQLFCIGNYQNDYIKGFGEKSQGFEDINSLCSAISKFVKSNDCYHLILVKGSRSAGMETAVESLVNLHQFESMRKD